MTNFEILGIPETATPEEIKAAYRANIKKYHPDVNDAPNAAAMFRLVEQAYRELMQAQAAPPPFRDAPPESEAPPPNRQEAPPPPNWQEAPPFSQTQRSPSPSPYTPPPSARSRRTAVLRMALRLLYHLLTLLSFVLRFTAPFISRFGKFFRRIVAILTLIIGAVSMLTNTWANGSAFNTLGPFIFLYLVFLALDFGARHSTGWLDAKIQKLDCLTRQAADR